MCKPTAERILDATLVTLSQHGADKLSISEVSSVAGVSRPTLYRYYATKEELLLALARHEQRRFDEGLAAALADVDSADGRVDALLHHLVAFLDAYPGRRLIDVEPVFVLDRLRRSLPVQRDAVERLSHDVLVHAAPVRSGATTTTELAEVLVRVVMSHYLLPHPDPDALLAALRGIVGVRSRGASNARR
jgi:TetR/AcrR family transcriptional regulator, repressor for uid operon